MKILFVTPFLPSPPRFGGQRRLDGLMRSLAVRHELSLLSFNATDEFSALSLEASRSYCREVITFPDMEFPDRRDKRLLQARSLLSRRSFEHLLLVRRKQFAAQLRELLAATRFDIVQVEFAQMAAFELDLRQAPWCRSVLDEHNIEYDIIKRTAASESSFGRRLYSAVNWRKLEREERRAWRRFDGVSVTSQRDATILKQQEPDTEVLVVPNGVDVHAFQPSSAPPDRDSLLFFGAMNYYPNEQGINHFIEHIFPHILARRPATKLWIVGPAPESMRKLQSANVEVTGFVDAVEPYLDRATAVVVPLLLGGGTRLKIVEAMAKAKPIISTKVGAEGIDIVDGEHALLADDPREFADRVERVLANAELASSLGRAARRLAEERYGWPALVANLESFYARLLASPTKQR